MTDQGIVVLGISYPVVFAGLPRGPEKRKSVIGRIFLLVW
jgi:hypothetical protein